MSKNKRDTGDAGVMKRLSDDIRNLARNYWRGRHRVVLFTDRVEAMTKSNRSTYAFTNLDLSPFIDDDNKDTAISSNAIAVILQVQFNDSGSASTNCYAAARPVGSPDASGSILVKGNHIGDNNEYQQGIVKLDDAYTIEERVVATGASTANVVIYILGYIEQLK